MTPLTDLAGYFTRAEGLLQLKTIQAFWEGFEGDPRTVCLPNAHLQLTENSMYAVLWENEDRLQIETDRRLLREKEQQILSKEAPSVLNPKSNPRL